MEDNCPICFESLENKERATPNVCNHVFCLSCLEKWSKFGSYCPVDRQRYTKVINLVSEDVIQIRPRRRKKPRAFYDVSAYCEVCNMSNETATLLLCDCCDLAYHCKCLNPPLQSVPAGLWNCPVCVAVEKKLRKRNGNVKGKEESPKKKSEQQLANYSSLKRLTGDEDSFKTKNQSQTSKEPLVMLEKIKIQTFLPSSSACGSESEAGSSYGGSDIRNKITEDETNVNPYIEYSPPVSQNAVVNEDISSEIFTKNFESNFNSNIFVDKNNLATKHLPSTSLTRTSQNEKSNSFDSACARTLNTFEIIPNKLANKRNGISEPTLSVASSSSTITKAVNMNHALFPNTFANKKNAVANRQSSEFSSFENTQRVGIENNAYKTGQKKHVLSHKYMFLDDVSSFQNNNKPFSVFENLDDTVIYKSKYEFKTPPFKTYYFKPEPKHGELCTISLQKSQNYKQREKVKLWKMDKFLCKKFHTDTNKSSKLKFYKCETKGGYSLKCSTLMYEIKKIEKQKWRLEKSQLNTYTIENDKKWNSAVPRRSTEKFPSTEYPPANCIYTHKKEKIIRDNEAGEKLLPQNIYTFEEKPVYSKYIIGNPENSTIDHNYYIYTNSE